MACSCNNTSFTARASPSYSSSSSASSSTAYLASLSFRHIHQQFLTFSSTNKHALLRCDYKKKASYVDVSARQGNYDSPKKNTNQKEGGRGGGGGRNTRVAVKEDKVGKKGGSSGGRNSSPHNNNDLNNNYSSSNTRYNSSSNPKLQNNSSSDRRGQRLAVFDEEEDDEDHEDEGTIRKSRSNSRAIENKVNSLSSSAKRGTGKLSKLPDEEEEEEEREDGFELDEDAELASGGEASLEHLIMPIPPAGFVLAEDGSVAVMAPPHKRITTLVDPQSKLPLDCLIRRVFSSTDGRQCFLLCPLDAPLQILKIEDGGVLKEISDVELEDILPTAAFELAKQRLHLVQSGFCLTMRGGFCFSEEDVIDLNTVYGDVGDTSSSEGVEVANFVVNDSEYLIFTPFEPLLFVAYKDDKSGELLKAEDDLMDDEEVLDAIDEENEFLAYMEEEITEADSDEEE